MKIILLIFSITLSASSLFGSTNFIHRDGKTIVDSTGNPIKLRGLNLGGWLLWEGWIWGKGYKSETTILTRLAQIVGDTITKEFQQQIYETFIGKDDIAAISQSCFNVVRIPINHRLLEDDSLPYTYKQSGWNILDSILNWCEQYKVYAILDMHSAPGGQSSVFIADPDTTGILLWDDENNKLRTIALWRAIAERYKNRTIVAGYDLLNEPSEESQLVDIYTRIIQAIREVDTNHMLILEGTNAAQNFSMLSTLLDSNMTYSFHIYTWFGEDPKAKIYAYKTIVDSYNVPMWCGEWGENRYPLVDSTKKALEDTANELSGWSFWTWKKVINNYPCFTEIQPTALWTKLINWINAPVLSPKPTYNEAILGMSEFIQSIKYTNNITNDTMKTLLQVCDTTAISEKDVVTHKELLFAIFPNPVKKYLAISFAAGQNDKKQIQVYNAIGVLVKSVCTNQTNIKINVANLSKGTYFIRVKNHPQQIQKFIKQ
ncbi:MAG: cellulase family glycosylhydrolase [bacterium]